MKFSYRWLQEYIDIDLTAEDLSQKLTFSGIEVEAVEKDIFADYFDNVVVARIVSQNPHPQRDNLFICEVDDGISIRQVICGAPNCHTGLKSAYIPSSGKLGNLVIEKIIIAGIESDGMLCSEKDLNLSNFHDGIIELASDAPIGEPLKVYWDLYDTLFEVEITPNRPDLLGIKGIARDLTAIMDDNLKKTPIADSAEMENDTNLIENREPSLCTRYQARVIKNVTVDESPIWLKRRLRAIGLKPVNNLVDITNFVMMELGHPIHAFDYDKLSGRKIVLRRAQAGEEIETLDNKSYQLNEDDLVIADIEKPVAIAGVIGGTDSSITKDTKNILLETANFLYTSIRKTAQRYKIFTDSSHRFERNLSDDTIDELADRTTALILELCGGKVTSSCDCYPSPVKPQTVSLRPQRANKILNTNLSSDDIIQYLEKLGLQLSDTAHNFLSRSEPIGKDQISDNRLSFKIPHFRKDLTREIDLIEELIRLHGYNNVASGKERLRVSLTDKRRFLSKRRIADFLCHYGFYEVINSSFSEKSYPDLLELPEIDYRRSFMEIDNPIGSNSSIMRTSLLPGILQNVQLNLNNGQSDMKLFELGRIYYEFQDIPVEKLYLSGIVTGNERGFNWKFKPQEADIFTVKGTVEALLSGLDDRICYVPDNTQPYIQKGQGLQIKLSDKVVGHIGKFDPLIAKQFDIEQSVYLFDIDLETILHNSSDKDITYKPIVRYPTVERDISFIVNRLVSHIMITETIISAEPSLIKDILLIDEFAGKEIPPEAHSLTYRLFISSQEGTLTDETIQNLIDKIFEVLSDKHHIQKR